VDLSATPRRAQSTTYALSTTIYHNGNSRSLAPSIPLVLTDSSACGVPCCFKGRGYYKMNPPRPDLSSVMRYPQSRHTAQHPASLPLRQ
jgi:hypothetical protein